MTETTTSADGTTIAYEVSGSGPSLVIIGGAFNHRHSAADLARLLSENFTVYVHDRRGRGDSGDTLPYAVEREIDDLAAVIDATGGAAMVYGHSSGAILSLLGAAAGLPVVRVAAYEPPWTHDPAGPPHVGVLAGVRAALAADDREAAVELFMGETGMPPAAIAGTKLQPFWPAMIALAATTEYDLTIVGDGRVPADELARISVPTLLIAGGISPPWAGRAADIAAESIPDSRRLTMPDQHHGVDQAALAPVLSEFFGARTL